MTEQFVVLALKVRDVRLGDITDHLGGRMRVREIVQRAHLWDLAGDPPEEPRSAYDPEHPPTARRTNYPRDIVRVWRPLDAIGPVRGHGRKTTHTDMVIRGWYRYYSAHTAGCSCGWRDTTTHAYSSLAETAWLDHKAAALTAAAYETQPALRLVTELQAANTSLAPVPWTFGPVYNGPAEGGGMAKGRLDGLPVDQARAAMAGWAAVLGAEEVHEFRYPARQGLRGWKPPRTELTLSAYGGERALVELAAYIEETAPAPESGSVVPWEPDGDDSGAEP
ncbi:MULTISPECIES: hypothetical protein [Streptomyces]|uniref:Uncharacterized protein n=1 Tax=Streptomyces caniscabiei TaxID=2746961 RepID=A0ABU4MIS6_9ACTN|nr:MULTISPECIES: hypothetical protein [Streptomyces]MBE4790973.1 hypothetical protein [Streptomyces caniscabiei]MDX3009600.1 hypothetical protein [Streptomyces caniscabiei]MDX3037245.1 hypothetical protein [Streptomyces caniscabiei]MDX3634290.1 hypothetical protein [Streptomyces europaeiscabiei]MDX3651862.1 hypothetical protein [Streptomyces europaeiscabiei]